MAATAGLTEDGVALAQQQHRVQLAVDVGGGLRSRHSRQACGWVRAPVYAPWTDWVWDGPAGLQLEAWQAYLMDGNEYIPQASLHCKPDSQPAAEYDSCKQR